MRLKVAAHKKEKKAGQATLEQIRRQEQEEEATHKKQEGQELHRVWQCDTMQSLEREGAW